MRVVRGRRLFDGDLGLVLDTALMFGYYIDLNKGIIGWDGVLRQSLGEMWWTLRFWIDLSPSQT